MAMEYHERIMGLRMSVESFRHEDMRTDKYIPAPEVREQLAADSDVANELAIRLRRNGRDLLIQGECGPRGMRSIDMQLDRRRIQITRLVRPLLPLPPIGRQFQRAAVCQMISLITI